MPLQGIRRVICGTHKCDSGLADDIAHAHGILRKLRIAQVPHFLRGLSVQDAVVSEISLELQMAPVVQRVPDPPLQCLRPFLEFLPVRGVPCDILLLHAVRAHEAPFIVVSAQPYLSDVVKFPVLRDLLRVDVAVVIKDRSFFRIVVEQLFCSVRAEQEIFVHKLFHDDRSPFLMSAGFTGCCYDTFTVMMSAPDADRGTNALSAVSSYIQSVRAYMQKVNIFFPHFHVRYHYFEKFCLSVKIC